MKLFAILGAFLFTQALAHEDCQSCNSFECEAACTQKAPDHRVIDFDFEAQHPVIPDFQIIDPKRQQIPFDDSCRREENAQRAAKNEHYLQEWREGAIAAGKGRIDDAVKVAKHGYEDMEKWKMLKASTPQIVRYQYTDPKFYRAQKVDVRGFTLPAAHPKQAVYKFKEKVCHGLDCHKADSVEDCTECKRLKKSK